MNAELTRTEKLESRLIAFLLSTPTGEPSEREWMEHARRLRAEGLYCDLADVGLANIVNETKNLAAKMLRNCYSRPMEAKP